MYLDDYPATTPMAVGWTTKETQYDRFKAIFGFVDDNTSILDYGCGLGHLNDFIKEIGYNIEYTGIDINPKYISYAIQFYPDKNFICSDIENITGEFDYVVGSGVFTWLIEMEDVIKKIETAYKLSKKGVIFNFLDKKSGLDPLNLYDQTEMVKKLSYITENILVINEYLGDEDFTIYLKK
jgi:SAM-dependent methyltransferase